MLIVITAAAAVTVFSGSGELTVGSVNPLPESSQNNSSSISEPAPSDNNPLPGDILSQQGTLSGTTEQLPDQEDYVYNLADDLQAVYLVPGKDFFIPSKGYDRDTVIAQIDSALDHVLELGLNGVIVQTASAMGAAYSSRNLPMLSDSFDAMEYLIDAAKERDLYIYCVFQLMLQPGTDGELSAPRTITPDVLDLVKDELAGFALRYRPDALVLSGYCNEQTELSYSTYLRYGGGIGFENYMHKLPELLVTSAVDILHQKAPGMAVGILTDSVWANNADQTDGSATTADFAVYTDGNADVKSFLEDGLFDFVMVEAFGSQGNAKTPFNTVVSWWNKLAKANDLPLYIVHGADRVGTGAAGWNDGTQLVSQLLALSELDTYYGSVYNSLDALLQNPLGSTDNLAAYFKDRSSAQFILAQLEFSKPTSTTYTTTEPSVTFQGGSDPRNPLMVDGKEVSTSESGYFSITKELVPGLNTFVFTHKGKTVTFKITRTVVVIDSISPEGSLAVDGGMEITVSAYAYDGSTVSASLNGETVELTVDDTDDNEDYRDSNYVKYSGTIRVPEAQTKTQKLGNIVFQASYLGYTDSKTGASVTVNAAAKIGSGKSVKVTADEAETFPVSTLNDLSNAGCYPLPKGALDYTLGDELVYKEGNSTFRYYILESGQRVYSKDITSTSDKAKDNKISGMSVSNTGTYTYVTLTTEQKVSYTAAYDSSGMSFTFHYTTEVPGNLNSLTYSPLFSSAKWSGTTLTLKFRVSGGMMGYYAYYDSDDNLVLRFNNVPDISGAKIVIDPGHGGTDIGAVGFNPKYNEDYVNRRIGKLLATELSSRGANVLFIKTDVSSGKVDVYNRMSQANSFAPQLFISVHNNSAATSSAKGHETYYFYPWSSSLASRTNSALGRALGSTNRGYKFGRYYVTRSARFAATLVECAFMSNYDEYYNYLLDETVNREIAVELADAVEDYLDSIRADGNYKNGTDSVGKVTAILPSKLTLDQTALALKVGKTAQLKVTLEPDSVTDPTILWTSSDEKIATVSADGLITAVQPGKATITATAKANSSVKASCEVTVEAAVVPVSGINLGGDQAIQVGQTINLTAEITPSDATNKKVTWTSSNPTAATVDDVGKVTALAPGETTVTATAADGSGVNGNCRITVSAAQIAVTGIELDKTSLELTVGDTTVLTASVTPGDASDKSVNWSTSEEKIAAVDQQGQVRACAPGTATITAKTSNGKTAVCVVTVKAAPIKATGVTLDQIEIELTVGDEHRLTATVEPAAEADQTVKWSSDHEEIATVDQNGNVIARAEGNAKIKAETPDGAYSAECEVIVSPVSVEISGVALDQKELSLLVGETETLTASLLPEGVEDPGLTWKWESTSPGIAAVENNGKVTAVGIGTAEITITVSFNEFSKSDSCTVTVEENAESPENSTSEDAGQQQNPEDPPES